MPAPRVLVLGGGYVAMYLARGAKKAINAGELECTVVNRSNFQAFHGFAGEMVSGRLSPSHICSPARRLFPPAQVHVAEIQKVDLKNKVVTTARSLDGARTVLSYDHLVVCMGTQDRTEAYPGLAEHAFRLKAYEDCLRLRNHIIQMFELAEIEKDPEERRRLLTFFIAGGGYAGTELAGELADLARLLTNKEYRGIRREECRHVLVHPGPTILPELYGKDGSGPEAHPKLVEAGMRRMRKLGVEVLTETKVAAATPNEVQLSNGERIPTRTIISAVGMQPQPIVEKLDLPKDEGGRIVCDEHCRVEGYEDIWAGGDCAAIPLPKNPGVTCPSVAIYAMKQGHKIGKNLSRVATGKEPKPFTYPGIGQGASVGRRYAVAELKGIEIKGFLAWVIWRTLLTYYFPSWDRRLRIMTDWCIWPIVGRDIVELPTGRRDDYDIRHNVFQPGEIVAQEERTGKYIHVIVEGEVELLDTKDGMEQVLDTLGPGAHFGTRWLESFEMEVARAKTVVRTVALRRDQAPQLQEVLRSTRLITAESGHFPAIVEPPR
ncbi:MAG: FAD-dependent oxidoreductase [Thermoleophilaceae bacterium]